MTTYGLAERVALRRLAGAPHDERGWVHEDDAARVVGRAYLAQLVRADLAEMEHTKPARPGDRGYTVWYRPKAQQ
jgi:hypothetical protein